MIINRMTVYTVHLKADEPVRSQKPIFVKEGFNFIAFLLPLLWALYQRLWAVAFCIVLANVGIAVISEFQLLGTASQTVLAACINLVAGFSGNDWVRARLMRQGYVFADISVADSLLRAQQRYFDRCLAAA